MLQQQAEHIVKDEDEGTTHAKPKHLGAMTSALFRWLPILVVISRQLSSRDCDMRLRRFQGVLEISDRDYY